MPRWRTHSLVRFIPSSTARNCEHTGILLARPPKPGQSASSGVPGVARMINKICLTRSTPHGHLHWGLCNKTTVAQAAYLRQWAAWSKLLKFSRRTGGGWFWSLCHLTRLSQRLQLRGPSLDVATMRSLVERGSADACWLERWASCATRVVHRCCACRSETVLTVVLYSSNGKHTTGSVLPSPHCSRTTAGYSRRWNV
jgi:hypothetical protein